ncbi:DMT family transporter [uncultured Ralstonia sp.]|jgi:drug/metabolite transporter (DMT)-like permease|uniref:DMT family transporter n=1 Tax=Ralstonia sp. TaxID=54061 RepID=UPI001EAAE30F|nr:DMT family transporter [uncultured Ralstonia sp.]UCF25649.1 MAG: DMT family transporter [Ralstonia sp.]
MAVGDTSTATHLAQTPHTPHDRRRDHLKGIGCGVAAGALWGVIFVAPKMLPAFSPLALSAARYLLYGVLSLALALPVWRTLWRKTTRRDWAALLWLSLPGNLLYYLCVAGGVQRAGVAPVSLIVGLLPVTVTLAGAAERGSVPLRRLALPLLMAAAGVVCIYADAPAVHAGAGGNTYMIGLLMAAGALACWTVYAVCNARYLRKHPQFSSREWSLLTGIATGGLSVVLAVPAFLMPGMATSSAQPAAAWWMFWLVNAGVALGASVLGNSLWNAASRKLPLTLSGQMIVFETVFALLYGFVYEGRWPHWLEVLAALLLVGGVALAARRHA